MKLPEAPNNISEVEPTNENFESSFKDEVRKVFDKETSAIKTSIEESFGDKLTNSIPPKIIEVRVVSIVLTFDETTIDPAVFNLHDTLGGKQQRLQNVAQEVAEGWAFEQYGDSVIVQKGSVYAPKVLNDRIMRKLPGNKVTMIFRLANKYSQLPS